jgi:hypothetical protein
LEGKAAERKRGAKRDLSLAWHAGAFAGQAFAGKLEDLSTYLNRDPESEARRGNAAALSALFALKSKGVPMTIERIQWDRPNGRTDRRPPGHLGGEHSAI